MGILIMVGQLFLSLSILIILHEVGHFVPARFFNTRVEKFYLFFDPWFSLFKVKKGDTEYGIGWLPLGGYVKISGMIDESMDREQMKQPPQPWEFRSKPAWQRLIIMLGGVTVNFILGFLIFAACLFTWGEKYFPAENLKYGIHTDSLGMTLGLLPGDELVAVGDKKYTEYDQGFIIREVVLGDGKVISVRRNGQVVDLPVPEGAVGELASKKNSSRPLYEARIPFIISGFGDKEEKSPAFKAGLEKEDQIYSLNGSPINYYQEWAPLIKGKENTPVNVGVIRGTDSLNFKVTTNDGALIGVLPYDMEHFFKSETREYTFGQSIPAGVNMGVDFLTGQAKAYGKMASGEIKASESLGGFRAFAKLFGTTWNWQRFWLRTAMISLILAFMNLLPIPALDGGHVMFLLYEVITGRKPSDKFMEYATIAGFVFVISLVIYANYLDWFG